MSRTHCIIDDVLLWALLPQLPAMPSHLIDKILNTVDPSTVERQYHVQGKSVNKLVTHVMTPISDICLTWMQQNIDPSVNSVWNAGFPPGEPKVPAHTDARRSHGINYILTTGSKKPVITQFYKSKRSQKIEIQPQGLWFVDESDLVLIDEVEFQSGSWWYINTRVIHGTNQVNLSSTRNIFGIGYPGEPGPKIKDLLNSICKGN